MFISRLVPPLRLLCRSTGGPRQPPLLHALSGSAPLTCRSSSNARHGKLYSTAADNTPPPRRVQLELEPELDEALVPRKMSVSPLESWLSLHYSLPAPLLEAPPQLPPREDAGGRPLEESVLPPPPPLSVVPALESGVVVGGEIRGVTPRIGCKNVLEIRRRKMNRHKYKKLTKRMRFVRRKVLLGRARKKQNRFEEDMERIWTRAGLKEAPEGYTATKIFIRRHGNPRD